MNEFIIEHGRTENDWRDLWRYCELFHFLAWRHLLVRYKQTVIDVMCSLLRPVLTVRVLTAVFGEVGGCYPEGRPYPILVIWIIAESNLRIHSRTAG